MKLKIYSLVVLICLFSCTKDRDLDFVDIIDPNENEDLEILHYWNFNDTSNLTEPTLSLNQDASLTYLGDRLDDVNEGSSINSRLGDEEGSALRLRNPSGDFIIQVSTEGFESVLLTYAVMRTNNGPQIQKLSYSVDGVNYTTEGLVNSEYGVATDFTKRQFDFSQIEEVNNNPSFRIKIEFEVNADGDSGNSRFDNITIDAVELEGADNGDDDDPDVTDLEMMHYWNFNDNSSETALISPTFSIDQAELTYQGNFFDDTDGTTVNVRNNDPAGTALRLRNPAGPFTIKATTANYEDVKLSYAARRTDNGAQQQVISYSLDGGNTFTQEGLATQVFDIEFGGDNESFQRYEIDFTNIEGVNDNPDFQVQIDFAIGNDNSSGNNRIDNLVIEGNAIDGEDDDDDNEDVEFLLMHYWNFNDTDNLITPTFSFSGADLTYEGNFFDDTDGSPINARNNDPAGDGLRLRNPAGPFTISASTENYENVKISYAARRTNNGAQQQLLSYSLDNGQSFSTDGLEVLVFDIETGGDEEEFELFEIDLSSIPGVQNNPDFQFQINFAIGEDSSNGNNRIDNLVIEGSAL